jgi:hypothetical protein
MSPVVIQFMKLLSFLPERHVYPLRIGMSRFLPWDPLSGRPSNPLSLFILTSKKDLNVLPLSIGSILSNLNVRNCPITIVSPASILTETKLITERIFHNVKLNFRSDESVLEQFDMERSMFPNSHSLMQILKFLCTLSASTNQSVVFDGDTIFLKERTWASADTIALIVPPEYQISHVRFVMSNFPFIKHSRLGFTTQSQLMDKIEIIRLIERSGGIDKFVSIFLSAMEESLNKSILESFPCEWQVYGDWILAQGKKKTLPCLYKNANVLRSELSLTDCFDWNIASISRVISDLQKRYSNFGTITLHAYLTNSTSSE